MQKVFASKLNSIILNFPKTNAEFLELDKNLFIKYSNI
jgi:hypothetical protein